MTSPAIPDDGGQTIDYRCNLLEGLIAQAQEHFDSVVVIATAQGSSGDTFVFHPSKGNLYASVAAAERFVAATKQRFNKSQD